jgi:hypothetical protein
MAMHDRRVLGEPDRGMLGGGVRRAAIAPGYWPTTKCRETRTIDRAPLPRDAKGKIHKAALRERLLAGGG